MSVDTPTKPPAPPRVGPAAQEQETATTRRRPSRAALIGAAPVAIGGMETVGLNWGTPGLLLAGGISAGGYVLYRLRGVLLPLAGLRSQRQRGRGTVGAMRSGGRPTGRAGVLSRLRGLGGATGSARSGGSQRGSGGRRGPLGALGSKARLLGKRGGATGRGGGGLGKALGRAGAKRASSGPLRRAAGAIGRARRSGGKGALGAARSAMRGSKSRTSGARGASRKRAPGRSASTGGGPTKRGLLGRLTPKGRGRTNSGTGWGSRGGRRGLLGGKGTGSRTSGRKGIFGGKGRLSSGGRGRGSSSVRGGSGLLGRRKTANSLRGTSGGRRFAKPASRPMTKKQRNNRREHGHPMSKWQTALERRNRERQERRKTAKDALTAAREANQGMTRAPIPNSEEPSPPSEPLEPYKWGTKTRHSGRNTKAMPNPFEPVEEAMAASPAIEVENARTVMDFNEHAPEFAQQTAAFWKKHGEAIKDGLPLAPEYGEALDNLHGAMGLYAEDVAETGAVWKRAHEEKIQAIEDPLPNAHKWDIALNRE